MQVIINNAKALNICNLFDDNLLLNFKNEKKKQEYKQKQ